MSLIALESTREKPVEVDRFTAAVAEVERLTAEKKRLETEIKALKSTIDKGSKRREILMPSGFRYERYDEQKVKGDEKTRRAIWKALPHTARFACFHPTKTAIEKLASTGVISQELAAKLIKRYAPKQTKSRFSMKKSAAKQPALKIAA